MHLGFAHLYNNSRRISIIQSIKRLMEFYIIMI